MCKAAVQVLNVAVDRQIITAPAYLDSRLNPLAPLPHQYLMLLMKALVRNVNFLARLTPLLTHYYVRYTRCLDKSEPNFQSIPHSKTNCHFLLDENLSKYAAKMFFPRHLHLQSAKRVHYLM